MKHRLISCRNERGFTLVELMVVVGLLVILGLLTTSFDTASWLAQSRLKGAGRDLYANVQKARMNALKENKQWAVVFDTANNRYLVSGDPGIDTNWGTSDDIDGPDGSAGTADDPQVVSLASYGSGITFGHGSATAVAPGDTGSISDPPVNFAGTSNVVLFNPTGLSNSGYCYLTNDKSGSYAVGTSVSGSIRMKRWVSGAWQ